MRVKFLAQGNSGAFDGARTHDWQVSTDHESDALSTAPRRLFLYVSTLKTCIQPTYRCDRAEDSIIYKSETQKWYKLYKK